jgi:hypothetical protein
MPNSKLEELLVPLCPEKSDNIWAESFYQQVLGTGDYGFDAELEGFKGNGIP